MLKRILSAAALVPVVILLSLSRITFLLLTIAIIVLIHIEFSQMVRRIGGKIIDHIVVPIIMLFPIASYFGIEPGYLLLLSVLLISSVLVFRRRTDDALISLSASVFSVLYTGWLYGYYLTELRSMENGLKLILLLLAVIWLGDTGAYFTGKAVGRHKLIPQVSPKKTIEGSVGGLLSGVIGAIGVKFGFGLDSISLGHTITVAVLMGVFGQIGDLTESMIKRNADMKDSGGLIPGHGGMFDRCDSMIPTVAIMVFYLRWVLS